MTSWNNSFGRGNYWSDLLAPDEVDPQVGAEAVPVVHRGRPVVERVILLVVDGADARQVDAEGLALVALVGLRVDRFD